MDVNANVRVGEALVLEGVLSRGGVCMCVCVYVCLVVYVCLCLLIQNYV